MKRIKGFTLIELLAVIVILAVIALITTPAIINVIENARKKAFEDTAYGVLEGLRLDYTERTSKEDTSETKFFTFPNSGLKLSGEEPSYGKASIDSNGNIEFTLADKDKRWCIKKEASNEKVIVENYSEETCALDFSFEKDSWSTLATVLKTNPTIYGETEELIGKEREVKIDGYKNGTEDTFTVRLANLTPCTNEESQTACGIVFEFVDIVTEAKMNTETEENPNGTNAGGWPASELYNEVNTNIYNRLPEELKKAIIDTKVLSSHGNQDGIQNYVSIDKLYLLSTKEVWDNNAYSDTTKDSTRQLDYYRNNKVSISNNLNITIKKWNDIVTWWWLRSSDSTNSNDFYIVNGMEFNGYNYKASSIYGVAPSFRIG